MIENKYKQKLSSLLGEIGERLVAYELIKRDWNVHKNLSQTGFDLYIQKGTIHRKIEVKTRDAFEASGEPKTSLLFSASPKEMETCDAVICYARGEKNIFLIVQKNTILRLNEAVQQKDKGKIHASIKDGEISGKWKSFVNNWDVLD